MHSQLIVIIAPLVLVLLSACESRQRFHIDEVVSTSAPGLEARFDSGVDSVNSPNQVGVHLLPIGKVKKDNLQTGNQEAPISSESMVVHVSEYRNPLYRGNVKTEDVNIQVDPAKRKIRLKGKVKLRNKKTQKVQEQIVDLEGEYDKDGEATLVPINKEADNKNLKVRSRTTCLEEEGEDCARVIADIFVQDSETKVYNMTQVQSKPPSLPKVAILPRLKPSPEPEKMPVEKLEVNPDINLELHPKFEAKGDEGEADFYVGHIFSNFEELFDDSYDSGTVKGGELDPSRPRDQAVGQTDKGSLKNASDLTARIAETDAPVDLPAKSRNRFYGTFELVETVLQMGFLIEKFDLGYNLQVSDLSQKVGGHLINSAHLSHQNGLDVDVGYITKFNPKDKGSFPNIVQGKALISDFLADDFLQFLQDLFETSQEGIDRIFVDGVVKAGLCARAKEKGLLGPGKQNGQTGVFASGGNVTEILRRLRAWEGHANHFHLRLKCSKYHPRCRQMAEPPAGSGC